MPMTLVGAVIASFAGAPGVYNIADDLPASQNAVIEYACDLLGQPWPPLRTLEEARFIADGAGLLCRKQAHFERQGQARARLGAHL